MLQLALVASLRRALALADTDLTHSHDEAGLPRGSKVALARRGRLLFTLSSRLKGHAIAEHLKRWKYAPLLVVTLRLVTIHTSLGYRRDRAVALGLGAAKLARHAEMNEGDW